MGQLLLSRAEPSIVDMLIILSKMRESLSPSECFLVINNLIEDTETQKA